MLVLRKAGGESGHRAPLAALTVGPPPTATAASPGGSPGSGKPAACPPFARAWRGSPHGTVPPVQRCGFNRDPRGGWEAAR